MSNGIRIQAPQNNFLGAAGQGLSLRNQFDALAPRRETRKLQLQGTRDTARLQSIVQGAHQLKGITSDAGKLAFLQQRRAQLQKSGLGTEDTDEAIALAQAGRFDELGVVTDRAIAMGQQISGQGLTPRQRELKQFQGLPSGTPEEQKFKQQFGQAIGAIAKRATVEERADIQQQVGDIKVAQDIVKAAGVEEAKLTEQVKSIPREQRVKFLSTNKQVFEQDISESRNVVDEIDRAIEIWESAPGTISGPLASRLPSLTADSQELESILAGLGIERLSNFKGATSERELATAFRAGASIEQDRVAGIRRLKKQRADIERNNTRIRSELSEANNLLRGQPREDVPVVEAQAPTADQQQPLFSSALNREISEQDIIETLQANPGLTREQLLQQLGIQ